MSDLIDNRGAMFNAERTHRQKLWRVWDDNKPALIVIGMNPSKADENDNDPTVERCVRRAMKLGYGGVVLVNMIDVIETDSRKLDQMPAHTRSTEANTETLFRVLEAAQERKADILCAWGKPGHKLGPVAWFSTQANRRNVTLFCLGRNKDGSPVHPLYQPYSKKFEWFCGTHFHNAATPLVDQGKTKTVLPFDLKDIPNTQTCARDAYSQFMADWKNETSAELKNNDQTFETLMKNNFSNGYELAKTLDEKHLLKDIDFECVAALEGWRSCLKRHVQKARQAWLKYKGIACPFSVGDAVQVYGKWGSACNIEDYNTRSGQLGYRPNDTDLKENHFHLVDWEQIESWISVNE